MKFRPTRYHIAAALIVAAAAMAALFHRPGSERQGGPLSGTGKAATLVFEHTTADLGQISEDDAPMAVEFPFRNTGKDPVVITRVRTTCGCTVPEYPREPIRPGADGVIRITYHPKGHPGTLDRSVRICTSSTAGEAETQLRLTGKVSPTQNPYPHFAHRCGALRLMQRQVKFGKISVERPSVCRIHVVNGGTRTLRLSVEGLPPHITFRCEPEQLAPGAEGDLCFRAAPTPQTPRGAFNDLVLLMGTGTARPSECSIRLRGEVF